MARSTKNALAESLKKLLADMPLEKITIKDVTDDCGINRMTFYYHFKDIYELLEWMCIDNATRALEGKATVDTWQLSLLQLFDVVLDNKTIVMNVVNSIRRDLLDDFLYNQTFEFLIKAINEQSTGITVEDEDKKFIADFYKYAFVGILMDWIKNDMQDSPAAIIDKLSIMLQGDMPRVLNKFRTERKLKEIF